SNCPYKPSGPIFPSMPAHCLMKAVQPGNGYLYFGPPYCPIAGLPPFLLQKEKQYVPPRQGPKQVVLIFLQARFSTDALQTAQILSRFDFWDKATFPP